MTTFITPPLASPTLGDELNPDPTSTLTVGQRPHDAVLLFFATDTNVLVRPGINDVILAPPISGLVQVLDADEAEVGEVFDIGLSGTPTLRIEVACDNGELTSLSIKQVLTS